MICPVMQQCDTSCVTACLSAVLNKPFEEVFESFHHKYHLKEILPSTYIESLDVEVKRHNTEELEIFIDRVYLLAVPSLNIEGGLHMVVSYHNPVLNKAIVIDPNTNRPDKKFYTNNKAERSPLATSLSGWVPEVSVSMEDVKKFQSKDYWSKK